MGTIATADEHRGVCEMGVPGSALARGRKREGQEGVEGKKAGGNEEWRAGVKCRAVLSHQPSIDLCNAR